MKTLLIRWLKRDIWKAGMAIAGILLLLVLMVWVPVSAAGANGHATGLATPVAGTVQATPTPDATATLYALNKRKLESDLFWAPTALGPLIIGIAGLLTVLYSVMTWRRSCKVEQKKQAEARFHEVVEGLAGNNVEEKLGAAIVLRTFVSSDYKQFNRQVFDLAVAHLRLRPSKENDHNLWKIHKDAPSPELSSFRQALISCFTEALPGARDTWKRKRSLVRAISRKKDQLDARYLNATHVIQEAEGLPGPHDTERKKHGKVQAIFSLFKKEQFDPRYLNATHVILDKAYLWGTDLQQIWLGWASLQETNLCQAKLGGTWLWHADLREADLRGADLRRADLGGADLHGAGLSNADLCGATLWGADLSEAWLCNARLQEAKQKEAPFLQSLSRRDQETTTLLLANLHGAYLRKADLRGATLVLADLREADLREADLRGVDLRGADLRGAKLDNADLSEAKLRGILLSGPRLTPGKLTKEQVVNIKLTELELTDVKNTKVDPGNRSTLPWEQLRQLVHYINVVGPKEDLDETRLLFRPELSKTNIEKAKSLKNVDLREFNELTNEQLNQCKDRDAIIPPPTSSPQAIVSPSAPLQSTDAQAPLATSVQGRT